MRNRLPQARSFHRGMLMLALLSVAILLADTVAGVMGPARMMISAVLSPIIYFEQGLSSADGLVD